MLTLDVARKISTGHRRSMNASRVYYKVFSYGARASNSRGLQTKGRFIAHFVSEEENSAKHGQFSLFAVHTVALARMVHEYEVTFDWSQEEPVI